MVGMRAKKNCMAMLLIVGGIVAVFLACLLYTSPSPRD